MHYQRWLRHGTTDPTRVRGTCTIADCDRSHVAQGYCRSHYMQWRRTGDPLTQRKAPNGTGTGYIITHQRLALQRGKPSRCEHCGTTEDRKYQWALAHDTARNIRRDAYGTYSEDLSDYIRLCVPCHVTFDLKEVAS